MKINKPLYVFVHVPRTGGTTFLDILRNNLGKDKVIRFPRNDAYDWNSIDAIHGHMKFSMVENFKPLQNRKKIYLTWLRDPVDRTISFFNHSYNDEIFELWSSKPTHFKYNAMVYYIGDGDVNVALERLIKKFYWYGISDNKKKYTSSLHELYYTNPAVFNKMNYEIKNKTEKNHFKEWLIRQSSIKKIGAITSIENANDQDMALMDRLKKINKWR